MGRQNSLTQQMLENKLHQYQQASIIENTTLDYKFQLAKSLQKIIALKEDYIKQQHQKRYGIFARFLNPKKTVKNMPFLQQFETQIEHSVFSITEALKAVIITKEHTHPAGLHQAVKLFILLQDFNHFPAALYTPFKQSLVHLMRQTPLLKSYQVMIWDKQIALLPHAAANHIKPYRRWPEFLFQTHNTCHDFIKNHSEPLAIAAGIFEASQIALTLDDLTLADTAIQFTMDNFYTLRAKKDNSKQTRDFLQAYIQPITSRRQKWLEKKLHHAILLLENIRNTLVRHYPLTLAQLCVTNMDFKANCTFATSLVDSIQADQQQAIKANPDLMRQFEAAKSAWLTVSRNNQRCLQLPAMANKSSFIDALAQDIEYLTYCSYPKQVSKMINALTLLKNILINKKNFIASKFEAHSLSFYLQSLFEITHTHYMTFDYFKDALTQFIDTDISLGSDAFDALAYHFPELASERIRQVDNTLRTLLGSNNPTFIKDVFTLLGANQPNPSTLETEQRYEKLCQETLEQLELRFSLPDDATLLAFSSDSTLQTSTAESLFRLPDNTTRQRLRTLYQEMCFYDLNNQGIQINVSSTATYPNSEETSATHEARIDVDTLSMHYFDFLASPKEEILNLTEERLAALWKDCKISGANNVLLKQLAFTSKEGFYPELCDALHTFLSAATPMPGKLILDLIQPTQHRLTI